MRLVILDTAHSVGIWAAKYVMKQINTFKPGPDRVCLTTMRNASRKLKLFRSINTSTQFRMVYIVDKSKIILLNLMAVHAQLVDDYQ